MSEKISKVKIVQVEFLTERGEVLIIVEDVEMQNFGIHVKLPKRETMTTLEFQVRKFELAQFYRTFGISKYEISEPIKNWLGLEGEVKFQN